MQHFDTHVHMYQYLCRCLKQAGYNFSSEDLNLLKTAQGDHYNSEKEMFTKVFGVATQFMDLMTMCRATIVKSVKSEYKPAIETLPLPLQIKKYLLYEDLPAYKK